MTIMAVDDERFILDLVRIVGAEAGHLRIVTATSGPSALQILSDPTQTFDYFLLDITMPDMDGIALCHAIRQIPSCRDVPIVMLTARRDMHHIAAAFQAGASDYATKPFDVDNLRQRLQMAYDVFRMGVDLQAAQAPETAVLADHRGNHVPALIDRLALSHYITRLSPQEVAGVYVFAIRIDGIATIQARHAPAQITALLQEVAIAVSRDLEALSPSNQTVMAYTGDSDLIVVTDAPVSPVASGLTAKVASCLESLTKADLSNDATGSEDAGVIVGTCIELSGNRSERARLAIAGAIAQLDATAIAMQAVTDMTASQLRLSGVKAGQQRS